MNEFLLAVWKAFCPFPVPQLTTTSRIRADLEQQALRQLQENALNLNEETLVNFVYSLLPRLNESFFDRRAFESFYKFEVKDYKDVIFNSLFLQSHLPLNSEFVLHNTVISKLVFCITLPTQKYYVCRDLNSPSNITGSFYCYSEEKFNSLYNKERHNRIILDTSFDKIRHENMIRNLRFV